MAERYFCKVNVRGSSPRLGSIFELDSSGYIRYNSHVSLSVCCGKKLNKNAFKYCSLKCQHDYEYQMYVKKWQAGLVSGTCGIQTRVLSRYVERYLRAKFGEKCSLCGWNKINPITGHVPLEIDHIDGNSENSTEENLRIICPNCHSLTPNFRNLNKGKGREWRINYINSRKIVHT